MPLAPDCAIGRVLVTPFALAGSLPEEHQSRNRVRGTGTDSPGTDSPGTDSPGTG
jgi:hypothetical protein